jgi:hypothetical protein
LGSSSLSSSVSAFALVLFFFSVLFSIRLPSALVYEGCSIELNVTMRWLLQTPS